MDEREKLKILRRLSQAPGAKSEAALKVELSKTIKSLDEETDYYALSRCLEELSVYAFRVYEPAIEAVKSFLDRLGKSKVVSNNANLLFSSRFSPQTHLAQDALDVIERLRYFDLQSALEIFCNYSADKEEKLRKKALDGLRKCASYDIDIYYSGENRAGLGESPQLEIINFLESHSDELAATSLEAFTTLSIELLSPTMEGTSWSYQSVALSSGSVPATKNIASIRKRTIDFLKSLYHPNMEEEARRSIIRSLLTAAETPRKTQPSDDLKDIIEENTISVLAWINSITPNETFPVRLKIERDVYWIFYHAMTDAIRKAALDIRDLLLDDQEYDIFRTLIGFEGVFEDWEESLTAQHDYSKIRQGRKDRARQFVDDISIENWPQWQERIFKFCETRSSDLATFPIFYDFLNDLTITHPKFGYELVSDHLGKVEHFTIPLYRGLWKGPLKEDLKALLSQYANEGKELAAICKLFFDNEEIDHEILSSVLESACCLSDEYVLAQLLSVATSNYERDKKYLVDELFVPALSKLCDLRSKAWVQQIWLNDDFRTFLSELDANRTEIVLSALVPVESISYESEEMLKTIASNYPESVVEFFGRRIEYEDGTNDYESVPFAFQGLSEPLSKVPSMLVASAKEWFLRDQYLFQFNGGRFVANVFPRLGKEIETALLPFAKSKDPNDIAFVVSILRSYHGGEFLHSLCREIVLAHPDDKSLKSDISFALMSTGVVSGEFGFADAYDKKAKQIKHWLEDEEEAIRDFAKEYLELLENSEATERVRAEEEIALRKHKFGESETE